jgi:adenine phosphoribosyltransferase
MKDLVIIQPYKKGLADVEIRTAGLSRKCPLIQVEPELWIADNEHLCYGADLEFTQAAGRIIAEKLAPFGVEYILTPAAKSIAIAFEASRRLGHTDLFVAKKDIMSYRKDFLSARIKSITSGEGKTLYLNKDQAAGLKGKKVAIVDDVISTCSTMDGLLKLAGEAGAEVACLASVWVEGPWPFKCFRDEFDSERLIFLDVLPLFASGSKYEELMDEARSLL